ncbi:MAG: hypothetical protein WB986_09350 [Methanoregula sp.]|uniref:hypothetical protein n=1 Tax=Methanoregula sp. TaxID=2052170 RepID=UPI003C6B0D61
MSSRLDPLIAAVGRGIVTDCPSLFKGGRSAARRVVSVGMLVHPRKRTKHGRRVLVATAARTSTASGREGNEPLQR